MIATTAATQPRGETLGKAARLAAVVVAMVLVVVGLDIVRDPDGPARLFSAFYGLLGEGPARSRRPSWSVA